MDCVLRCLFFTSCLAHFYQKKSTWQPCLHERKVCFTPFPSLSPDFKNVTRPYPPLGSSVGCRSHYFWVGIMCTTEQQFLFFLVRAIVHKHFCSRKTRASKAASESLANEAHKRFFFLNNKDKKNEPYVDL